MSREKIAKRAARQAAVDIFNVLKKAPTVKVASEGGIKDTFDIEVAAKNAAVKAYKAVIKAAQTGMVPPDARSLQGLAMRFNLRNLANYIGNPTEEAKPYAQPEVEPFLKQYRLAKQTNADGQPVPPDVVEQLVEAAKAGLREVGLQA